jgi:hypothetical protein
MSKYVIVTTLMVLTLLVACERKIDSEDPVRSAPTMIPIPANLMAVIDDGTVTLNWELVDSSDAAWFRVYIAESEEGEYLLHDSTATFSITLSDLLLNQQSFLRVTTVTTNNVESQPSLAVSAISTHFSININNNSEYTNLRDIQVRFISGVSALYVQISEQQDFSGATWESFGASKSFELSEDDGVKTVYARLQFADGSETGQPLSDEITLDTYAEIETLYFYPPDGNIPMVVGDEATLRMNAGESGGVALVSYGSGQIIELYDNGTNGDVVADDGTYTNRYTVPYGAYAFNEVVTGSFTDIAGNRADEVTTEILMNINSIPTPVSLGVNADIVSNSVVFTWSTSLASDFESYRLFRNSQSPVETTASLVAIFMSSGTTEYETTYSSGEYRLFVFDRHGAFAGSNERSVP